MPTRLEPSAEPTVLVTNLRRLLTERRMSQGELADAAELTRTSISAIMHGGDLKLSSLERIAAALKTDAASLLTPLPIRQLPTNHRTQLKEALAVLMSELLNK